MEEGNSSIFKSSMLCHGLRVGMATWRGGHGFRYPIPIPVKKIHPHPHPHTQTQQVLNF